MILGVGIIVIILAIILSLSQRKSSEGITKYEWMYHTHKKVGNFHLLKDNI